MPTYSYRCAACGHDFERVQRISEDPNKECIKCGKLEASRQITQGNFILKGSGWYGDLYSGASNSKVGASSTTSTSTSTTSTESSTSAPSAAPATSETPATSAPSTPSTPSGGTGSTT
ncbi:MAG: zinc ribbon domain-containing protein [Deltaproteobacteria bacterium]|nr:zinc ribbon domain-containing protein [Deltaproteobacteria bacterium]